MGHQALRVFCGEFLDKQRKDIASKMAIVTFSMTAINCGRSNAWAIGWIGNFNTSMTALRQKGRFPVQHLNHQEHQQK